MAQFCNRFDTGNFTANFGTGKLTGTLSNPNHALSVGVDAGINTANASFNGNATAAGQSGTAQGHFFGNGASALAGAATFAGRRDLDTAFGGAKTGQ